MEAPLTVATAKPGADNSLLASQPTPPGHVTSQIFLASKKGLLTIGPLVSLKALFDPWFLNCVCCVFLFLSVSHPNLRFPACQVLSGNWMAKAFHVMNLTAGSCAVFVKCWRSNATCRQVCWEDLVVTSYGGVTMFYCFWMFCGK